VSDSFQGDGLKGIQRGRFTIGSSTPELKGYIHPPAVTGKNVWFVAEVHRDLPLFLAE